jgi:DNA polymerase III epsilon subunit-like protein
MSTPALAFVDTETTGLDPFLHEAWEIAVIVRKPGCADEEYVYRLAPDVTYVDPKALEINRFLERVEAPGWHWQNRAVVAGLLSAQLKDAILVGSNPAFDAAMISKVISRVFPDNPTPWHYRPIDIVPLAVGFLYGRAEAATHKDCDAKHYATVDKHLGLPWKSYTASEAIGVERPAADVAHTALGDARWARDVYDMVTIPDAFYAATDDQLSQMAGEALSRRGGGQLDKGEWVFCSHPHCPNGERHGKAVERGWRQDPEGAWLCDAHPAGGAA